MNLRTLLIGIAQTTAMVAMLGGPCLRQELTPPLPRPATDEELREARANRDDDLARRWDPNSASSFDLQFLPRVLDFGEVFAGVSQTRTVRLVNVGDSPIEISRVLWGRWGRSFTQGPIPPNSVGETAITLNPPWKQGVDLHKKATVLMNGRPPRILDIEGHVAEYVRVAPDFIEAPVVPFLSRRANDTLTDEPVTALMFVALDGMPFNVSSLAPQIASVPGGASFVHVLPLDPAACGVLDIAPMISITTDHPRSRSCVALVLCHASSKVQ